ncbi:MAG: histidine kinase [Myxococcales bacterium]|nr:histidine kinase [Myxococcales bacterium]
MQVDGWFDELKRYVRFGPADEAALRGLAPLLEAEFVPIADTFYDRILEHEGARQALAHGESTVGRLKKTLYDWMSRLLSGPWDDAYFHLRCRIGRVHVRIALPEHYMFGAMNVLRTEFAHRISAIYADDEPQKAAALLAVNRILDIEQAIMLHTYREDMEAQQARAERLSTFGQLVGSIGHELRNPLGVMESSLYILKSRVGNDERIKKHADRIGEQIAVANNIISALLDMIRDKPLLREPVQLERILQDVLSTLKITPDVRVSIDIGDQAASLHGDPTQLGQALRNLVENALHAVGPAGFIAITTNRLGDLIEIAIADSGPGVDPVIQKRLFEPLISAKPGGIGLGLSLVRRIIERHGGTVSYAPDPQREQGARFVIRLPILDPVKKASAHA